MLLRNAGIIFAAAIVSVACYQKVQWNRHSATLSEAMQLIERNYLEKVGDRELFEAAMSGMTSKLDPHSSYIPPRDLTEFQASLDQEFGGIGVMIEIHPETKRPTIITPIFDTPAYRAGVRAGDVILKVDGIATEELTLREAVDRIHGKVGEPVRLTIQHPGQDEPVEMTIVRAVIRTDSVLGDTRNPDGSWNFFLEEHPRILLLRVTTFGERTAEELRAALQSKDAAGRPAAGAIIDLRDNAGGLLGAAVGAADLFLDDGLIVSTKTRGGIEGRRHVATRGVAFPNEAPVVILVNRSTASAAEILAACLQDHGRAVVVGQRTWGKGTVQNVLYLEGGQSAIKITTASYWRPSNRNIHRMRDAKDDDEWGVKPDDDCEATMDDETTTKVLRWRRYRDQFHAEKSGVRPSGTQGEKSRGDAAPKNGESILTPPERADDPQLAKALEIIARKLGTAADKSPGTDKSPAAGESPPPAARRSDSTPKS